MTLVSSSTPAPGVKVAVQVMLSLVWMSESAPLPTTVKSVISRPVTASEKVIVSVAVSPIFKAVSSSVMELTVGRSVSTAWVTLSPVALSLPAMSVMVPPATDTAISVTESLAGVTSSVKVMLSVVLSVPAVPPVIVMSPMSKPATSSEKVKVKTTLPPAILATPGSSSVMASVGAIVSTVTSISLPMRTLPALSVMRIATW